VRAKEQSEENDDQNVGDDAKRGCRGRQGASGGDPSEYRFPIGEQLQHRPSDRRLADELSSASCELGQPRPQLAELSDELRSKHKPGARQDDQEQNHHKGNCATGSKRRPARKRHGKVADGNSQESAGEDQEQHAPQEPEQNETHEGGNEEAPFYKLVKIVRSRGAGAHDGVSKVGLSGGVRPRPVLVIERPKGLGYRLSDHPLKQECLRDEVVPQPRGRRTRASEPSMAPLMNHLWFCEFTMTHGT
jgi:hypothetical protein